MNIVDCIRAAKSNLSDARRYLETGEAVNWVPDHLSGALLWAMEAWLLSNGHETNYGNGWASTREMFLNVGPEGLRSEMISCY